MNTLNGGFQHRFPEAVLPTVAVSKSASEFLWQACQRALAGIALVALSPLVGLMWCLTKLSSPGPFLFAQQRPGLNGRPFKICKVRTLRPGSEAGTALGVTNNAAVVTPIGRILRALKLDELPQLWNVARGDMALVGPRPIPLALDKELRSKIPGFALRYSVRPGLTSIGQICVQDNALGDALTEDWKLRFEGELHYLRHRSVCYDLLMVGMTGLFVLRRLWPKPSGSSSKSTRPPAGGQGKEQQLLGVPVRAGRYPTIVPQILNWAQAGQGRVVGVCNVHSITMAGWDPNLREALQQTDLNTADGVPLVWMQRLLGARNAARVYGPDLMLETLREAEPRGLRVAFYGGHPDRLPVLIERLLELFPSLQVVEAISPPFRPLSAAEDAEYTRRLREAQPHIVWVGLGCPKQERWMHAHRKSVPGVMIGVGAAFDFHAGFVRQAPNWIQRVGLEWAFRLCMEPKRLFRRYLTTNPVFILRASIQLVRDFTSKPYASS